MAFHQVNASFNGWGAARALPLLALIAPCFGVGGRVFACWAAPDNERLRHERQYVAASALLTAAASASLFWSLGQVITLDCMLTALDCMLIALDCLGQPLLVARAGDYS